ncbi:MAG TPA: hypothetical protein VNC50_15910 [Planctomycetia bacterium]|nr:hypothetical protein [Planctomycetia bacterium]
MAKETFVGRQGDLQKLQKVLLGENRARGALSLLSIEGPGGIGKTALFDHAMATSHLTPRRYLTLRLASRDNLTAAGPFAIIDSLASSARAEAIANKPAGFYFPNVKLVLQVVGEVRISVLNEIEKRFPGDVELKAALLKAVDQLLEEGRPLTEFAQAAHSRPEFQALEKRLDKGWLEKALRSFRSVRAETVFLSGILPDFMGASLRNAVKENALKACADALLQDLAKLLTGRTKVDGIERLLLVIDDYEFLMRYIGDWLVAYLLPGLRDANFQSIVTIVGRDKLAATHAYWNKELAGIMVERIPLKVLELQEFVELCRLQGVTDAALRDRIWRDTSGFPYLIQLWLEELDEARSEGIDGPSALMLRSFYDRTTRFMSAEQRGWLDRILFLDDVNKRTLKAFFSDSAEVDRVQEWFEGEPSIRDPNAQMFRVRDQLRTRLREYLRRKDPDRFDDLARQGKTASPQQAPAVQQPAQPQTYPSGHAEAGTAAPPANPGMNGAESPPSYPARQGSLNS